MQKLDVIIVGQGIAGTMLAFKLWQEGKTFTVIDDDGAHSSRIASGIINPVTGRRFVKSWRVDALLALADQTYPAMEQLLNISCYEKINIQRKLHHHQDVETWMMRSEDPGYSYLHPDIQEIKKQDEVQFFGIIQNARLIHAAKLLTAFRQWLDHNKLLISGGFNYSELQVGEGILYRDIKADHLVFCEGWKILHNPFFKSLPIIPTKGERLLVAGEEKWTPRVYKDEFYIICLSPGQYWIGPTNEWDATHDEPTDDKKQILTRFLNERIGARYSISDHAAAFRPAAHDRRPVVGPHPFYPGLHVINGLGTKGYSLAPYCAATLYDSMYGESQPDHEMHWSRFKPHTGINTALMNVDTRSE